MKSIKKLVVWIAVVLLIAQPVLASEASGEANDLLEDVKALYEYAWGLDYPTEETYDVIVKKTSDMIVPSYEGFPSAALGYQIKDFDRDNEMELLVIRSRIVEGSSDLVLQIYEAVDGKPELSAEMLSDIPSFAREVGKVKCYSYTNENCEILIGCDLWSSGAFCSDGIMMSGSFYQYDGAYLRKVMGNAMQGSAWEQGDVADCFAGMGILGVDELSVSSGQKTAFNYLSGTEFIVTTECRANPDLDFDLYFNWSSNSGEGDTYVCGYAAIFADCWLPTRDLPLTKRRTKELSAEEIDSMDPAAETGTDTAAVQDLASRADYLYIDEDFNTATIMGIYYLIPNADCTQYDCYSSDGMYICSVPYGTAKQIVDNSMTIDLTLPNSGGKELLVWNSPYGLCAYHRNYRDYYPQYRVDANGNTVEVPVNLEDLPYLLDESEIQQELEWLSFPDDITIPSSEKTE